MAEQNIKEKFQNFNPTATHRICSAYFADGKKKYMNNIPTIFPKTIKPSETAARITLNSSGVLRALPIKGNFLAGAPMEKEGDTATTEKKVQKLQREI